MGGSGGAPEESQDSRIW